MTYARLQNYTNMVVGKCGILTFDVVVVVFLLFVVLFDVFVPITHCQSLIIFGQMLCPNMFKYWFYMGFIWW